MEIPPNRCLQRLILWPLQPGGRLRCCSATVRTLVVAAEAWSLGCSPPSRQMCAGLRMMEWRYWRCEGHNDLLKGSRRKWPGFYSALGYCANRKPDCPTELTAKCEEKTNTRPRQINKSRRAGGCYCCGNEWHIQMTADVVQTEPLSFIHRLDTNNEAQII